MAENDNNNSDNHARGKNKQKGHKKNGSSRQHQHHPWDEVSLPGATNNITDQPTILEAINQVTGKPTIIAAQSSSSSATVTTAAAAAEPETITDETDSQEEQSTATVLNAQPETTEFPTSEHLVNSYNKLPHIQIPETPSDKGATFEAFNENSSVRVAPATPISPAPIILSNVEPQVLDIAPHLIETYDEYQNLEDGTVGINELQPIQSELLQGSSKVDTADNLCSVIEVEPAGFKTKQPIDTLLLHPQPLKQLKTETKVANDSVTDTAKQLVADIEREISVVLNSNELPTEAHLTNGNLSCTIEANEKTEETEQIIEPELCQSNDTQKFEINGILKTTSVPIPATELETEREQVQLTTTSEPNDIEVEEPREKLVAKQSLKVIDVPAPQSAQDEQERKLFIDSLPQLGSEHKSTEAESEAHRLSSACKREYYQSLKKYLLQSSADKPPVPLQTYRWEDLRRAKERGGYPWTHLYKRPLGPDEEPEIVLLLRKSQELRFASESPKSLKKVRIDEQVLVKETERYIQELSADEHETTDNESDAQEATPTSGTEDNETHSLHSESISCVSDSVLAAHTKPRKTSRLAHIRALIERRRNRKQGDAQSLPSISADTSRVQSQEKLYQEFDKPQTTNNAAKPPKPNTIMKKLRSMADRQKKRLNIKRITLKKDEKIVLNDDTKIMRLKNSPKSDRSEIPHFIEKQDSDDVLEIMELDESPSRKRRDDVDDAETSEAANAAGSSHVQPDEVIDIAPMELETNELVTATAMTNQTLRNEDMPPRKTPRLRREHVYEEIEQIDSVEAAPTFELESVAALKESLAKQDTSLTLEIEPTKSLPLDRMGSSEEEQLAQATGAHLLVPISSIESASSEENECIKVQLSPVAEEADDAQLTEQEIANALRIVSEHEQELENELQLKPSIKKEASPAPSDKKVTFSHVEDEAEPHREDIVLPDEVLEAAASARKNKANSEHEYEPIGISNAEETPCVAKVESASATNQIDNEQNDMQQAEQLQRNFEERYFDSVATTPRTESRTEYEIHTSQVDSSALEELPLKPENRRKGFLASAQDRTRRMQAGFRTQAGKIKTKLRTPAKKATTPTGSPKAKERRRFRAPEFSKIKMPEIKRPDMSKFKDFKRPEFTKNLPEKFSTLQLRRSKSFKENEPSFDDSLESEVSPTSAKAPETQQHKKMFDFNFGTYPRAFRKKKKPLEPQSSLGTEDPSIIPSTETQPSMESSSSPKGDRGPGPVRSRWADKFSDVSYNDSEGSRYRRYGSELESFDRESSLERRMKDDLEDTGSEVAPDLGILSGADDTRQFAEFDEENRAIHTISSQRAGEFKRRPMVHQDSDLRSEDSKDVGWTDKEIQKNKLLRKAELEAEASYMKYPQEESMRQDTQSTASSGKKVVLEQIDDDEFFLRKRGISEDNIELRQYISNAIRQGYDMPINALQHVGHTSEPMEYDDYDIPPPKPRRLHKSYRPDDLSQEFHSRSEFGDDLSISQNGSDFYPPKRPLRKGRSRSKYSMDSQDMQMTDEQLISGQQYFDDDEEYLRPPSTKNEQQQLDGLNNLDKTHDEEMVTPPQPPRRRKRRETSMEKDSYVNGLTGRSVSSSYLQPNEDVIVYRTEHQYPVPLATPENYTDGSRSASRFGEDDRLSHGDDGSEVHEKYVIDMMENDGYAVVRKEQLPKPTPPARRKKFSRSPGERFATLPNMRTKRSSTSPPERPPPPRDYSPGIEAKEPQAPSRKSALSLETPQNYEEDDYEEPAAMLRAESPRDLHSGDVINKMKYRPLPAPPRPPREKRLRGSSRGSSQQLSEETNDDDRDGGGVRINNSSMEEGSEQNVVFEEVEASTQTDPLPDDFECEEFEITPDMKIIEPRRPNKTLEELLREEQQHAQEEQKLTADEQLSRGLQRFRDANQRSLSERSRASSQAEHSRSHSRPPTPSSAVIIERRVSTPAPANQQEAPETLLAASLTVRPLDDLDLEEEELRREGLLTDTSQQSKSDVESQHGEEEIDSATIKLMLSDYSASVDLEAPLENIRSETEEESEREPETEKYDMKNDSEAEQKLLDSDYNEIESVSERLSARYDEHEMEDVDVEAELERIRKEEQDDVEQLQREIAKLLQDDEGLETEEDEVTRELFETEQKLEEETAALEIAEEKAAATAEESKVQVAVEEVEKVEETTVFEEEIVPQTVTDIELEEQLRPQPPPRRKSLANIENPQDIATAAAATTEPTVSEAKEVILVQSQLPTHITDLEVERLRVHALQAGQIMVGQLHGAQISADDLECKSGSLVIKNLELPPGFIEDIVERVRTSERGQLLCSETQTSEHASRELLIAEEETPLRSLVPPPKPPRQRDLSTGSNAMEQQIPQHINLDEETQTEPAATTAPAMVPMFPTIEYLQSLAPLAFYNLERQTASANEDADEERIRKRRAHHHHHHHRCESSSSETEQPTDSATDAAVHRRKARSSPTPSVIDEAQSLVQASKHFVSACSLSLVKALNQLSSSIDSGKAAASENENETRSRQMPQQLVILFIVLAFAMIMFMLSGRNVHTHHWDYFNPPGNEGRPT